jgi:hypothetical protein
MDPGLESGSVHVGTFTGLAEPEQYEFKETAGPVPTEMLQLMVTSMRTITKEFFRTWES